MYLYDINISWCVIENDNGMLAFMLLGTFITEPAKTSLLSTHKIDLFLGFKM